MASVNSRSSPSPHPPPSATTVAPLQPAKSRDVDDDDLDPAAFLKSVRELSEKREREDNERFKKLEEDIEKGRQERLARRAERARSISPEKRTSASIPLRTQTGALPATPPPAFAAQRATPPPQTPPGPMDPSAPTKHASPAVEDVPDFRGFGSVKSSSAAPTPSSRPSSAAADASSKPSPSAAMPSRSGTMKWQQRPQSRGGASRPLSSVAAENNAQARSTSNEDTEPSRDQIAAALGARDPSWFRQTADRGLGNAAYRKSNDEMGTDQRPAWDKRGLPGMSRETILSPRREASPATESVTSETPSKSDSIGSRGSRFAYSSKSVPEQRNNPLAASDRTSSADNELQGLQKTPSMSSSQARLAGVTDRPSSPTKGNGGFVQSAMIKRSDSVSKRWTTNASGELSRHSSVRSGYGGLQGSYSMPKLEPLPDNRESSIGESVRPTSSMNLTDLSNPDSASAAPALPRRHSRTKSVTSAYTTNDSDVVASLPSSPSKRWSPNKSSWIESALTAKPESRPASPTKNSQPTWMADLAKAKAQRNSAESTPKSGTPMQAEKETGGQTPRFGQPVLQRSDSQGLATPSSRFEAPLTKAKPSSLASRTGLGIDLEPSTTKDSDRERDVTSMTAENAGPAPGRPVAAEPDFTQTSSKADVVPPTSQAKPKPKPSSPKPQIDFRSALKSRVAPEAKARDEPEFLARVGSLRRATTEKYAAPDLLKDNILRGKAGLSVTGGPQKRERRDELKESLIAKKDQWRKEKEEGVVHERKTSGPPLTSRKPEALAKRELLGQVATVKVLDHGREDDMKGETAEALRRRRSMRETPATAAMPEEELKAPEEKQSLLPDTKPVEMAAAKGRSPPTETSRLAAKFNPGLASMIARGPPPMSNGNADGSRPETALSPSISAPTESSEPPAAGGQLQDMRKGRAKGPKRRKAGAAANGEPEPDVESRSKGSELALKKAMSAPTPSSTASVMQASLKQMSSMESTEVKQTPTLSNTGHAKPHVSPKPAAPPKPSEKIGKDEDSATITKSFARFDQPPPAPERKASASPTRNVPIFKGFGSTIKPATPSSADEDKENSDGGLPSVKSAISTWGRPAEAKRSDRPSQIQLPSKKDEEAAMRSANLLASSPGRPGSSGTAGKTTESPSRPEEAASAPPKLAKPSRVVSGQLLESYLNRGIERAAERPETEEELMLLDAFGGMAWSSAALGIDTRAVISSAPAASSGAKTIRKTMDEVAADGSMWRLPAREDYTLFDGSVYICTHVCGAQGGSRRTELLIWAGSAATEPEVSAAQSAAKTLSKSIGAASIQFVRQWHETAGFLEAMGDVLITRRGRRRGSPKQFMLCGRKHLGHVVFDEVGFGLGSLCSAYAYLILYPVTLQEAKLYLWKGSACSTEEIGAARLAGNDLLETGEIIEVDESGEFPSFLKAFGPGITKASIPKCSALLRNKALSADRFAVRLFRVQQCETKPGLFANIFTRRPSWGSRSPASAEEGLKVEAKEISPFTQSDLEAEGIYLLDAFVGLYVLIGPLFASQPATLRMTLSTQALLFAESYAKLSAEIEGRPATPAVGVVCSGVPQDVKVMFRHWDEGRGLWGTAGLMAGSGAVSDGARTMPLDEVLHMLRPS